MILGIGLDLCEIRRIHEAIQRPRFLERFYTGAERARILSASEARRGEIAAGLFAAKEAVAKALGTGFDGFGPESIETVPDEAGRPTCTLHKGALERAAQLSGGTFSIYVSITHEKGMAAAVAVVEES